MEYLIHYDVAAIIITLALVINFIYKKNINTIHNRLFSLLMFLVLLSSVFDLAGIFARVYFEAFPTWLKYAVNQIYLIIFTMAAEEYFIYILLGVKKKNQLLMREKLVLTLPMTAVVILVATTPITGLVFKVEGSGGCGYGFLFGAVYIIALGYVLAGQYYVWRFKGSFSREHRISINIYTVANVVSVLMLLIIHDTCVCQFAVAVGLLLLYMSLESPSYYIHKDFDAYNRIAFERIVLEYIENKKPFKLLCIEIEGMRYISETFGVVNAKRLLKQFAEFIISSAEGKKVFYISDYRFLIMHEDKNADCESLADKIRSRVARPFYSDVMAIMVSAPMCVISYPENAARLADIMSLTSFCLDEAKRQPGSHLIYANEEMLKKGRREGQIIQIMKYAISQGLFQVYYQPIFSVKKRRFTSAEALIRLYNDELGFISPDEFIPLAEKNGLILEIGAFVFEEVCKFISSESLVERGIEYIDVNLSVVQCMQDSLHEQLMLTMNKYGLKSTSINLEITETAAVVSHETLLRNMGRLISKGVKFSLDDYGTGFSNTASMIKYPFHTVKLDKSMVWSAMEDEKAMYVLKYTIAMIKEMGMELIAEGVETKEQAELLAEMGCDFFQGYYYSKPVNKEEFLKKINGTV